MESLLWGNPTANAILKDLRSLGVANNTDPTLLVKVALAQWYESSAAVFSRDPNQGVPVDIDDEPDAAPGNDGRHATAWHYAQAAENHRLGNLGLMAVLMMAESWVAPAHPRLRYASLVANAATALLVVAHVVASAVNLGSWSAGSEPVCCLEGTRLLLRTTWRFAREGFGRSQQSPAIEFGATLDEIKVRHDGKRLMTRIGHDRWEETPYWHPCRMTPGSPWNKFIRNFRTSIFGKNADEDRKSLSYRLPSSAVTMVDQYKQHYAELRARFDRVTFSSARYFGDVNELLTHPDKSRKTPVGSRPDT